MKRFYTLVSYEKKPEGYAILLDGKAVKTASGALLLAQNEQIAAEIVKEWAAQEKKINPGNMPFTQILSTYIEQVRKKRAAMNEAVLKYLDTDLICYLADKPQELQDEQEANWARWRNWVEERFGHPLKTTTEIKALKQAPQLHESVAAHVEAMSDDVFNLLQVAVPVCGSLVLGLALIEGQATAEEIFKACFVEEHYKDRFYLLDEYGRDPLSEHKQQASLRDLKVCEAYRNYL